MVGEKSHTKHHTHKYTHTFANVENVSLGPGSSDATTHTARTKMKPPGGVLDFNGKKGEGKEDAERGGEGTKGSWKRKSIDENERMRETTLFGFSLRGVKPSGSRTAFSLTRRLLIYTTRQMSTAALHFFLTTMKMIHQEKLLFSLC